ncbi:hypothetical protein [Ligilactobacillus ruminis]|uniref:hypothetical protein n=1 Tax=Ligilactobacillus ruminis TaxID=1623 RepID=UPI0022E725A8|nr:hypothetical protein [Ligilactobacillus ruminis]
MQSVFCTFEYKMKAGHFVRSFFVWVRGLFAAVDGSVVMPVKQDRRLRAKHRKQGFARKTMQAVTGKMTKTEICP